MIIIVFAHCVKLSIWLFLITLLFDYTIKYVLLFFHYFYFCFFLCFIVFRSTEILKIWPVNKFDLFLRLKCEVVIFYDIVYKDNTGKKSSHALENPYLCSRCRTSPVFPIITLNLLLTTFLSVRIATQIFLYNLLNTVISVQMFREQNYCSKLVKEFINNFYFNFI